MGTSHRRDAVRSVVRRLREGFAELFALPDGYEVLLGNGGSSFFWDAAAFSLIERRSQHLVFGEFSGSFANAVANAPHLDAPEIIETPPGRHPDSVEREGIDVYALTHNETSTGVMMPIRRPSDDGLVVVDATSGAGGLLVDANSFDVYYFAPQKCFAADGGIWFAACSPAAIERIERIASTSRSIPSSLSLQKAIDNSRLDQTLNTPALATLFLTWHTLEWMLDRGGLAFTNERCSQSSSTVYDWAERSDYATPFVSDPGDRSQTVTTIDLDDRVSADAVAATLRANGMVDTESYRKLGRNQLRIACFPAIEPDDVERLTGAIDFVVDHLRTAST